MNRPRRWSSSTVAVTVARSMRISLSAFPPARFLEGGGGRKCCTWLSGEQAVAVVLAVGGGLVFDLAVALEALEGIGDDAGLVALVAGLGLDGGEGDPVGLEDAALAVTLGVLVEEGVDGLATGLEVGLGGGRLLGEGGRSLEVENRAVDVDLGGRITGPKPKAGQATEGALVLVGGVELGLADGPAVAVLADHDEGAALLARAPSRLAVGPEHDAVDDGLFGRGAEGGG